ncbi:inovirus-type Gp2 protein [Escherichia coli]|uniref:YagK/YfjJ domain-containing protein n=1 Tax=Escherichia coli TaxID=562 RepID=UPI00372D3F3C
MKLPYELSEKEFESLLLAAEKKYDSKISIHMLRRSLAVISNYLENNNRIFALRVDLRFAQSHVPGEPDLPTCFQKDDEKAIRRSRKRMTSSRMASATCL